MCGGAAGTIQNLSREEKCRALLLNHFGVVEPLADLLVGRHVKSQVGESVSGYGRISCWSDGVRRSTDKTTEFGG